MICTNKIIKIKKKTYKLIELTGNAFLFIQDNHRKLTAKE